MSRRAMGARQDRPRGGQPAPAYLCGADNSCLMHLDGIARRDRAPINPVHLAEILACTEAEPVTPPPAPAGDTTHTTHTATTAAMSRS